MEEAPLLTVYPGTFDPVTLGHIDIAASAARVFGGVRLAVVAGTSKQLLFSAEERRDLAERSIAEAGVENVEVELFDGLLVDYMRRIGATTFVRGLRANSDFEYEFQMQLMNRRLAPGITGIYLMPAEHFMYLSSTLVKEIARYGGELGHFVTPCVEGALTAAFRGTGRDAR